MIYLTSISTNKLWSRSVAFSGRINNDIQHFRILRSPQAQYYLWNNAPHFNSVNALVAHYRQSPVGKTGSSVLRDVTFVSIIHSAMQYNDKNFYSGIIRNAEALGGKNVSHEAVKKANNYQSLFKSCYGVRVDDIVWQWVPNGQCSDRESTVGYNCSSSRNLGASVPRSVFGAASEISFGCILL